MKKIIIRPTEFNNLVQNDLIQLNIDDEDVFIERNILWSSGYFTVYIPDSSSELGEWLSRYHIWCVPYNMLDYIGDPERELDLDKMVFDYKPRDFQGLVTSHIHIYGNMSDETYSNLELLLQHTNYDDLGNHFDCYRHNTQYRILNGFTIVNTRMMLDA